MQLALAFQNLCTPLSWITVKVFLCYVNASRVSRQLIFLWTIQEEPEARWMSQGSSCQMNFKKKKLSVKKTWPPRGMVVLSQASKLCCRIAATWLRPGIELKFREWQMGLRKNASVAFMPYFCMPPNRIETIGFDRTLYLAYISQENTFDRKNRHLWGTLCNYSVSQQLMHISGYLYCNNQCVEQAYVEDSWKFHIHYGFSLGVWHPTRYYHLHSWAQ